MENQDKKMVGSLKLRVKNDEISKLKGKLFEDHI